MKSYQNLHKISREIRVLEGVSSILGWDQETHMPPDGAPIRGEQLEVMAGLIHEKKTGKKFLNALSKLIDIDSGKILEKGLTDEQQKAVLLWRRDVRKALALPTEFVEKFAKLSSQSIHAWRFAKKNNSFQHFAPFLEQVVEMNRQQADYLGYQDHPYDALLDLYEPDISTKEVSELFTSLKKSLEKLLKNITAAKQIEDSFLHGKFPPKKQITFVKHLIDTMGYDMAKGRLDFSVHPFSSASHPTDSRITTFIHPTSLMSNIFAVLHEAGHGLYEMGLLPENFGTPLGDFYSMGVHESQSKWWENLIGQSKPYWQHFYPLLQKTFKGRFDDVSLNKFYRAINIVEPSFIRVDADEVTYSLHVILRFELEKDLIEGKLAIRDVPEAWNEKMHKFLGITPQTDAEGCLQDIHWSMGAFGYFPTYVLGNLFASHFFLGFEKAHPDWSKRVAQGELLFIKQWLNENVHQWGRRYTSKELLQNSTNKTFSAKAFSDYLNNKYKEIYKFA